MSLSLSELSIYPIKSTQPISLTQSEVLFSGLKNDRRFMLVDQQGAFVTGRSHPNLLLVTTIATTNGWLLTSELSSVSFELNEGELSDEYIEVDIWETPVLAQRTSADADQWFSNILDKEVKLVHFGENSTRTTSRRPDQPVGFADGYPFLLTTQASLEELNNTTAHSIEMQRFRTNFVITGTKPFAEDSWKRIKIGDVIFENVKPCVRCIFTTLDPTTAQRSPKGEPLKTLAKFRRLSKDELTFGVNLIAQNEGAIQLGDDVEILEYQSTAQYEDKR